MEFTHVFAGLPVSDYDAAVAWYEVVDADRAGGGHATLAVD